MFWMGYTESERDLQTQRRNERCLKAIMVDPSQWQMARRIARSYEAGENECLRGLYLPDRQEGRILWWPARYMAHWLGRIILKVSANETCLDVEVNRDAEGRLYFLPDDESDPLVARFLSEPAIRDHHDGYLSTGRKIIAVKDGRVALHPLT